MIELIPILPSHYEDLYRICCDNESFAKFFSPTLMHFSIGIGMAEGFSAVDSETGNVCGMVTFSEHMPLQDALLHVTIDRAYWRKWIQTRAVIRKIAEFAFDGLRLPRLSGMSIKGATLPIVDRVLVGVGFHWEGCREKALLLPDGLHDVTLYGLLRERCHWIA